ncbi:MAG: hypothetical protein ACI9F9_003340 [Candidatus Paceibacteria bacterium]|jgi:hypothetical protein
MNKLALALTGLGLFAGVACKSADSNSQEMTTEVSDAAMPVTLSISGMT